jgi:class 3 adenylate cyclase
MTGALLALTLLLAVLSSIPPLDRLDGTSNDMLVWLRHTIFGASYEPADSPTVVIALDEATYRTPPFEGLPKVMWTQAFGTILDATVAGGATVVGWDLVLPASVEQFIKGFDKPFLISLRNAVKAGDRVLLAKAQHRDKPISPHAGQSFAVGHGRNIRAVNLAPDSDGVIRRTPLWFTRAEGDAETSFSLELAARGLGQRPEITDAGVSLGGYAIPGSADNALLLNFDGGANAIPSYSFADLYACAEAGQSAFFTEQFAGKIVLVGAVLDVEDRKLTTKRFIAGGEGESPVALCDEGAVRPGAGTAFDRETLPGVYIHAAAINNMLRGDALSVLPRSGAAAIILFLALAAGLASLDRRPWRGGLIVVAGAIVWAIIATLVYRDGTLLPLLDGPIAAAIAFGGMLGIRLTVVDRRRQMLRRAFALYLSTKVIDRMLAGDKLPSLGGEKRVVTLFFSDVAGFTGISEELGPEGLVTLMNTYLAAMTDIIEAHDGFVDKYIGDAIVAVFGAPHDDEAHALSAVGAALACRAKLASMQGEFATERRVDARIGLNTGEVLVGNIGSERRFNYTVMGDPVNVAARLEAVNKQYGTSVLVSETTAAACGDAILFRELDRVRVKGREAPTSLFEPLAEVETADPAARARADAYASALALYRAGQFDQSAADLDDLAAYDPPAAILAARARAYAADPPPDWDGVTTLESK